MSETVLWTNQRPTDTFSSTTITLSQNLNGFKRIRIYWRISQSRAKESFAEWTVDEFKQYLLSSTNPIATIASRHDGTWIKTIWFVSTTQLGIGNTFILDNTTMNNGITIPTKIVGLS